MKTLYTLLIITVLASCSTQEPCTYWVEEFTHVPGSDIYKLKSTYNAKEPPVDYTANGLEHVHLVTAVCP
ncbi:hypothetical protein [Croceivirga sp. JEA036]|uniref:hypothetical protein n=1 Tax=Croceivirga sp. JEA036 TaxID=2721162 RepID=UPI00143A021E|nr:hypothetical protein [Croceivirga sp. JEA036]NJB36371.1 hypothetical protein [Croceivirga sp. JEA036]